MNLTREFNRLAAISQKIESDDFGFKFVSPHIVKKELAAYAKIRALSLQPDALPGAELPESGEYMGGNFQENWKTIKALPTEHAQTILDDIEEEGLNYPDTAKLFKQCQITLAREIIEFTLEAPFVLSANSQAPASIQEKIHTTTLQCHMYFRNASAGGPDDFPCSHLLGYQGIWTYQTPAGPRIAALAAGEYIVPARDGMLAREIEFMNLMDSHSAYLSDVMTHVLGTYLPKKGLSFAEFVKLNEAPGIATAYMFVDPALRGHGLGLKMLDDIAVITNECCCDNMPAYHFKLKQDEESPVSVIEGSPIEVFVLPVAGSKPQGPQKIHPELAYKIAKAPPRKVLDLATEKQKSKLTNYFKSHKGAYDYDVEVYDPWDYPIT